LKLNLFYCNDTTSCQGRRQRFTNGSECWANQCWPDLG